MLRSLLLWRITRGTYLTVFLLAFILLMIQIFRIGFIIFGLPLSSSVPFFLTWFAYYGFFFIPDGVLVSTALTLSDFKEKKLLNVLYSFQMSPAKVLLFFSIPVLFFFLLSLGMSFFLFEENVSFARRGLLIQYKDKILENIPEKVFLSTGDIVVYASRKKEGELKNVFLKYRNVQVVAGRARYEGRGRFLFERGSLLTREGGKYFLMEFGRYWLDTEEFLSAEIREKRVRKERIINLANVMSIPVLFLFSFFGVLKLCRTHVQVYYLIALGFVLHQLFLFGLKVSL